ncbi:MAG: DEAD/DEAH box helicase family protein, partial [Chloroflexota bacterium]|nr:DEAD/DEAH box helicase family protein [Chloroflexota bacterium]
MATKTLTPAALGLPPKFHEFRTYQLEAIRQILASDKKVVLMQAPTGVGKTLVMAALAKLAKEPVLYTCHTKQLQGQVVADFPYAVELKGRRNYLCLKNPGQYPDLTAQECSVGTGNSSARVCRMCQYTSCSARKAPPVDHCPCQHGCPYVLQKAQAKQAELAILNTPLFLAEANYVGDFSGWPWVVLDEGDLTEQALMSFIQVAVTRRQIENLRLQAPAKKTVAASWIEWANKLAIPAIQARLKDLANAIMPLDLREQKEMERLLAKLLFLVSQRLD